MQLQKIKLAKTMSHCRHSPNVQLTGELKIRLADFKFSILCQKLYRVFRTKNSQFKNWHGRQFLNRIRAATTRDVSGKKPCRRFCSAKTRSSKIGAGRRSIYNICIMNYCKLTFEFFKNYIFEKRRQFLNHR